jgi:hypothetical protein
MMDASAQTASLSRYEKCWVLLHPFAAIKVRHITKKCDVLYHHGKIQQELDSFASGGRLDAFRHVFYMAAYAQKVRTRKLRKLGEAHEKGNYRQFLKGNLEEGERPDSLSTVMDLTNNELGLTIGREFRKLTLVELERTVIYDINQGKAVIMKRNREGMYLDCENVPVFVPDFAGKWAVPKCLVSSDFKYPN